MAKDKVEKEVILNVTTNADEATLKIDKLTEGVKKNTEATEKNAEAQEDLAKESKKTEKEVDSLGKTLGDNTLVTSTLDKATGGLYSTFKDGIGQVRQLISGLQSYSTSQRVAKTATDATSTSIKGLGKAFTLSGVGIFAVALGVIVSELSKIKSVSKGMQTEEERNYQKEKERNKEFVDLNKERYDKEIADIRRKGREEEAEMVLNKASAEELTEFKLNLLDKEGEALEKYREVLRTTVTGPDVGEVISNNYNDWWHKRDKHFEQKAMVRNEEEAERVSQDFEEFTDRELNISRLEVLAEAQVEKEKKLEEERTAQKELLQRRDEVFNNYAITQAEKFISEIGKIETERIENLKRNEVLIGQERTDANNKTSAYATEQKRIVEDQEALWKTFNETFKGDSVATVVNIMDLFKGGEEAVKAFKNTYKEVLDIEEIGEFIQGIEINLDRIKAITDSHNTELLDINRARDIEGVESLKRFKLDELQTLEDKNIKELESLSASEDAKLQVYLYYANERAKVEEEASERSRAIRDLELQSYLAMADGVSGILDGLATASKEGSSIQKGLAIASVALDTGVSAISAFKGMVATFPGPKGIIAGTLASAGIALQGLNQINQLKKVKTDGTEKGGSATASATMTPNVQFVSSSDNQISNTIAEVSPEDTGPIKAYVVSSEVTTSQQLERNAVESSSL